MDIAIALVTAAMLVVGGIFTFLAAWNDYWWPLISLELATFTRAVAGFIFFILTAPIAAHLVARAAHQAGYRLSRHAVLDDMREHNRQRSPK